MPTPNLPEDRLSLPLGHLTSPSEPPGSQLTAQSSPRSYSARFVRAGRVRQADGQESSIDLLPEALSRAVEKGLFDKKAVFIDHAGFFDNPSLRDLVGDTHNSVFTGDAVEGIIEFYNTPDGQVITSLLDEILDQGQDAPDIGLSIVFYPVWQFDSASEIRKIIDIRHVESIDLVFGPAADGRLLQALSANSHLPESGEGQAVPFTAGMRALFQSFSQEENPMPEIESQTPETSPDVQYLTSNIQHPEPAQSSQPDKRSDTHGWITAMAASAARVMIASSGLPQPSRDRLLAQFTVSPHPGVSPSDLEAAIEAERAYLAALQEANVVQLGGAPPRSPHIAGMHDSLDRISLALDALINGNRPPNGIQPLTGVRELYHLLSGDFEMNGVFQADRVQFANVNSSTMAALVANALNKRLANEYQSYPQWWAPIVSIEDFSSLQDVRWITLGGIGELPTVAEGAAYTELSWDDKTETASFVKKGGYLGITLEAIDKDDVGRLRAAPRALAQAAWLTLSKTISGIFTSNSGVGPTMSDSQALFHTNHSNLGTTALSRATYNTARTAMRKQTELNSGERLGALTMPKYLLVPPDLELTALEILASEKEYTYALSNGAAAPDNVLTEGDTFNARMAFARNRVIVVDLWTDTNDWAAVSDPNLYPTIGLAFRYGRAPEIFSVASPTSGLLFTNDTMPVKVRFILAAGPIDWKGLYKANVA